MSEETWVEVTTVETVVEKVRKEEGGGLVCLCGNETCQSGFYPCLDDGTVVETTVKGPWQGVLYVCCDCGRIIDQDTLKVTGWHRDPEGIPSEAAEAFGWDD